MSICNSVYYHLIIRILIKISRKCTKVTQSKHERRRCVTRILTLSQTSEALQVSNYITRMLFTNGDIKARRVGRRGQWRTTEEAIQEYLQEGGKSGESRKPEPAMV